MVLQMSNSILPSLRDDERSNSTAFDGNNSQQEQQQQQQQQQQVIAKKETSAVIRLKLIIFMVFVASAIVGTIGYKYISDGEESKFKDHFKSDAQKIIEAIGGSLEKTLSALDSLAVQLVSYAQTTNSSWPFVTMPHYGNRVAKLLPLSNALFINLLPVVKPHQRIEWEDYSLRNDAWVNETIALLETWDGFYGRIIKDWEANPIIHGFEDLPYNISRNYLPSWQIFPLVAEFPPYGYDWPSSSDTRAIRRSIESHHAVLGDAYLLPTPGDADAEAEAELWAAYFSDYISPSEDPKEPMADFNYPIINTLDRVDVSSYGDYNNTSENEVVGTLVAPIYWRALIRGNLPSDSSGIIVVFESPCNVPFTYRIDGPNVTYLGVGDFHDKQYDHLVIRSTVTQHLGTVNKHSQYSGARIDTEYCPHTMRLYPSDEMRSEYKTHNPRIFTTVSAAIFIFTAIVFVLYDFFVERRQKIIERQADQSNAIVQDLFPGDTAHRLFGTPGNHISSLALSGFGKVDRSTIADLHPEATVLFADISGFTAWSSIRDPHQVFTLLESIFQAFDIIAKKCGVFKVETVGDCYVAACGVPKENTYHAAAMCRFARSAMAKFRSVCHSLELTLGPDTSDLALRIGMHSGPVTAGVLRGDRARFQLFGDTVNTASRIESTGLKERVHLSEQTANQLIKHGKEHWIVRRDDVIEAKGKGKLVTYWLKLSNLTKTGGSVDGSSVLGDDEKAIGMTKCTDLDTSAWNVEMQSSKSDEARHRTDRLVRWNSDLLLELLQRVVARRVAVKGAGHVPNKNLTALASSVGKGRMVVEEVAEVIDMPEFASAANNTEVELSDEVMDQLRAYITEVASMYNNNPFHNFEHASHVTMSINKLLTRIVAPKFHENACSDNEQKEALLHDHTCGITSDPLTQFSVVLSGLIHDLDHPGVSNAQLSKENPTLGARYQEKSVAEQNSVDLAWNILMSSSYDQLRDAIFSTRAELQRFRSLLVNSVIATDIFDKDQSTLRKNRWNKAFFETTPDDTSHEARSRKATIVIEHLIQASDVAHTMQHWHVYQKWNQRLFNEMMMAYRDGRSDKDPSLGWYGGELWFFDNYVIPLTQKLKDCGVFGVSSDEYLNYAMHNRDEWESKGKEVVQQYLEEFETFVSEDKKTISNKCET